MTDTSARPGPEVAWFRRDLRLADNPAWAASADAAPATALFVVDPVLVGGSSDRRRRLLFAHLAALDERLAERGGRLRVEHGDPTVVVPRVAAETGAVAVRWNGDTTPYARRRDRAVAAALDALDIGHDESWGTLVHRPGTVLTKGGTTSLVFTPFHSAWERRGWDPWPTGDGPAAIAAEPGTGVPIDGDDPANVAPDTSKDDRAGELAAFDRLVQFEAQADRYLDERDVPSIDGTSALSADLRFGTLSPRRVAETIGVTTPGRAGFVRQLAWRDWYAHLLGEHPHLPTRPLKAQAPEITWLDDEAGYDAWTAGRTGYPIVDAGMRELAATGRMHNRVRMICASFLVKDLLVDWRRGERWFRDQLLDFDVAQNVGNWQWAAGTGPDAAPYFRVFNPTTQSKRFDPRGDYIRRWVPELDGLDAAAIHEPRAVGPIELAAAGVILGQDYPEPIVDHGWARDRALAAYGLTRSPSTG